MEPKLSEFLTLAKGGVTAKNYRNVFRWRLAFIGISYQQLSLSSCGRLFLRKSKVDVVQGPFVIYLKPLGGASELSATV